MPIERHHRVIPLSEQAGRARLRLFFGGSFDPPHIAHTRLPALAMAILGTEPARLVYVPAARSPLKAGSHATEPHRLAMLHLALEDAEDAEIWEQELRDGALNPDRPSYWADTWAIVQSMNPPGENHFLIGADQALSMHRWRRYNDIWRDAVVMLRDKQDQPAFLIERLGALGVWSDGDLSRWRSSIVALPTVPASSTVIRAALADPARREHPIVGLDDQVHAYILENRLYTVA